MSPRTTVARFVDVAEQPACNLAIGDPGDELQPPGLGARARERINAVDALEQRRPVEPRATSATGATVVRTRPLGRRRSVAAAFGAHSATARLGPVLGAMAGPLR